MKLKYLLIFFILVFNVHAQNDRYEFEGFSVSLDYGKMHVLENNRLISEKNFSHPSGYSVDLDGDTLDEFIVIDNLGDSSNPDYIIYIYNTLDSFFLADSIASGYVEPYFTIAEETGEMIIITGNSSFLVLEAASRIALPVNCYRFESGELLLINDELYDIFIQENESIMDYLEEYFQTNPADCSNSGKILSAIYSAYANYINAGEPTLANQLISKYYHCGDRENLIKKMDELILN